MAVHRAGVLLVTDAVPGAPTRGRLLALDSGGTKVLYENEARMVAVSLTPDQGGVIAATDHHTVVRFALDAQGAVIGGMTTYPSKRLFISGNLGIDTLTAPDPGSAY